MEMRRDELKARARELERAGRSREACEVYLGINQQEEGEDSASLWVRIAYLQLSSDDTTAAVSSFATAIDLFEAAGQRNNALIFATALRDLAPENWEHGSAVARLAIDEGYRQTARASVMRMLEEEPAGNQLRETATAAAAFATRFTDDAAFWRDWAERAVSRHGSDVAYAALTAVEAETAASGSTGVARAIRDEIARLGKPTAGDHRSSPDERDTGAAGTSASDLDLDDDFSSPVPLLSTTPPDATPHAGYDVAPLAGLEPTTAIRDSGDEDNARTPEALLPLVEAPTRSGTDDFDDSHGEDDHLVLDDEPDDSTEPLPLLSADPPDDLPEFLDPAFDSAAGEIDGSDVDQPLPLLGDDPSVVGPFDTPAILRELASITTRGVDAADASTHYDLGLAFMEMDLVEESIAQFAAAIAGGFRAVASLEVVGEILVGKGEIESAARVLQLVTDTDAVPDLERVGVLYWLARCREAMEDTDEAHRLWRRVAAVDPDFRDTAERLRSSARSGL